MTVSRRLAAILAADVVGYSRLMSEDEAGTAMAVREHRDAATPIVSSYGGRIVKTMGDGLLLEFPSVVSAVECAFAVQKLMTERNANVPDDKRIRYRIGVHLGDVLVEGKDILGDGVNIAARLEGIAEPGGICISASAFEHVRGRIAADFNDLGEKALKNIARPVHVYSSDVGKPAQTKSTLSPTVAGTAKALASERRWGSAPLAAAIVGLVLLTVAGGWYVLGGRSTKQLSPAHLSIVVLPFANLSGDPAQDYLADSLTDELTTALARIRDSFVIARNTAFTYKGKPIDAKAIGKDLGVRYMLEGSVQPTGNQVRVNAQLIDTESGSHLWAEQFDTPRADLLQMQDEIVTHLARAMDIQLSEAEAARLKRTPAANRDAEDLALQCDAGAQKGGYFGKEADVSYQLCEQALATDPNNVHALSILSLKFFLPVAYGSSVAPKIDLERADELVSKALALEPNYANAHQLKAGIVSLQGRHDEAIAENEHALALDPALLYALNGLSWDYLYRGEFEKSLEFSAKAIRLSPHDPALENWYRARAAANFGLKQYDLAIEWARRAIAIKADNLWAYLNLIAALALTGRETEAHEALQNYLVSVPDGPKTIAAWKATAPPFTYERSDPRFLDEWNRSIEGLRRAGVKEE
jgi:TolB-like protein/class 3 adenylate cyclase/Flp pilus assembly protein TadD